MDDATSADAALMAFARRELRRCLWPPRVISLAAFLADFPLHQHRFNLFNGGAFSTGRQNAREPSVGKAS